MIPESPQLLLMLEHFGIGPAFGDQTVADLCARQGIRTDLFLTFASLFTGVEPDTPSPVIPEDVPVILKFLRNGHVWYREEKLTSIRQALHRMTALNTTPGMKLAERFFDVYLTEVNEHLRFEEEVVFPYIESLFRVIDGRSDEKGSAGFAVSDYRDHHEDINEKLNDLVSLLIRYLPVEEDLRIRRELLFSLFELEHDLDIHSRIEDKILVPLVEKMENRIREKR